MARLEEVLPDDFIRVHRSHIVNRKRITRIEGGKVLVGKQSLPIGDSYRARLLERLDLIN